MTLLEAIETADLPKITNLVDNSSEAVTEAHLLAAITNHEVDKKHCKQLFDAFKTSENTIPASCTIAALEQSRINIFLSIIRTNHPDAPTEGRTAKVQRAMSLKGFKQDNEAKYEQHKASFLDLIQQTFSSEERLQLHAVLNIENHPIKAVIGPENLGGLLAIVTPDSKEDTPIEHADVMSTDTPPPSVLSRQETGDTLNSDDVKLQSTSSDELNVFLEHSEHQETETNEVLRNDSDLDAKLKQISDASTSAREQEEKAAQEEATRLQAIEEEQKAAQEETARLQAIEKEQKKAQEETAKLQAIEEASLKAEQEEAVKQLVIEEAVDHITPHLDTLRKELLEGLGENAYTKIKKSMDDFEALAKDLAREPNRTQEYMNSFRNKVKTQIIPEGQAALLKNESYASFFCRKIMDALHVISNMLAPIFPSTKNSFFQTAPAVLAERFEASEHAIAASYGS